MPKPCLENIGFEEALELILSSVPRMEAEALPLGQLAGRTAARDIYSRVDTPSRDISYKDGYALTSRDIGRAATGSEVTLKVIGSVSAGMARNDAPPVTNGQAVRVTSGSHIPEGADAVLADEFCEVEEDRLVCLSTAEPGRNIIKKGSDVVTGQLLAARNEVLTPPLVGLLAAGGLDQALVYRRPSVAVLATGDEVVAPGCPLDEGKVYASNLTEICSWLSGLGFHHRTEIVRDNRDSVTKAIEDLLPQADALLTSGGAMRSERDVTIEALETLHWRCIFHRLRMGPGKALGFGLLQGKPVFCLPGGPPSNEMAFLQLALPGLRSMAGLAGEPFPLVKARLTKSVTGQRDWTQFLHARLVSAGDRLQVEPANLSSRLHSMARKEALIKIPEGVEEIREGEEIEVQAVSAQCKARENLPPIVSIVGKSDSGKTTLLEKILPVLSAKGYRIATIKHDAHSFDVDHQGKDSWRHREAGAVAVAISSPSRLFVTIKHERQGTIWDIRKLLAGTCDLIITEGFKREGAPKIEVNRASRSHELICTPEADSLIAVASDQQLDLTVPLFHIDDANAIAGFIEQTFLAAFAREHGAPCAGSLARCHTR